MNFFLNVVIQTNALTKDDVYYKSVDVIYFFVVFQGRHQPYYT